MVLMQYCHCEDVSKWFATIKVMPYDVGPTLVRNDVNGNRLLFMGWEYLKEMGVTKTGPFALLIK